MQKSQDTAIAGGHAVWRETPFNSVVGVQKVVIRTVLLKGRYLLLVTDLFFLSLSLVLLAGIGGERPFLLVLAFLNLFWIFLARRRGIYQNVLLPDADVIMRQIFRHWVTFFLVATLSHLLLFDLSVAPFGYYSALILSGLLSCVSRIVYLSVRKKYRNAFINKKKIAIIGDGVSANLLSAYVEEHAGCDVVSTLGCNDLQRSSNLEKNFQELREKGVTEIYCGLSSVEAYQLQPLLLQADSCMLRVKFFPDLGKLTAGMSVETIGNVPVFSVRTEPLLVERNAFVKRTFDIIFSSLVIVLLLSWLAPLIALLIKLGSKGPVFFKQRRSGLNGGYFYCYKFRSMAANNTGADQIQATKNDRRITRIGAFLRKTSLDELPQFFNVFRGNMSVVGPRPHMLAHTEQYGKEVSAYMIRHYVKPGITGWAQVNGCRGEVKHIDAIKKRVAHDIYYIESWSFFFDLKIIFLTVWNIIKGDENAY